MSTNNDSPARLIPAHLEFLSIYNPSLGGTENGDEDQIAFYWSKGLGITGTGRDDGGDQSNNERETGNERLRRVGLARGIVHFAGDFAQGQAVEHIDTTKSRIVLRELETGWWILASIALTVIPVPSTPLLPGDDSNQPSFQHSSREVEHPGLLLSHLSTAHSIFKLHHGHSLTNLFARVRRTKFCSLLHIYWTRFCENWDPLLHGNPAVDIFGGIKLAAGGELGVGVGEEEWGSGERDALEGIVRDEDGLVDLVVSRYGHLHTVIEHSGTRPKGYPAADANLSNNLSGEWLGTFQYPEPADGVVFSGTGAITRPSLRALTEWLTCVYSQGEAAYGVRDNPTAGRRRRIERKTSSLVREKEDRLGRQESIQPEDMIEPTFKPHMNQNVVTDRTDIPLKIGPAITAKSPTESIIDQTSSNRAESSEPTTIGLGPSIPRPIVTAAEQALEQASEKVDRAHAATQNNPPQTQEDLSSDRWTRYLKLGYGTSWSIPGLQKEHDPEDELQGSSNTPTNERKEEILRSRGEHRRTKARPGFEPPSLNISDTVGEDPTTTEGRFLIGLEGDLESADAQSTTPEDNIESSDSNARLVVRTVHLEVNVPENDSINARSASPDDDQSSSIEGAFRDLNRVTVRRLRVVVYINRPFIFTFLFDSATPSLSVPSFFRKLHDNLKALHRPLLASTSPSNVAARLSLSLIIPSSYQSSAKANVAPILDLVFDPYSLTVHSSIPNIPLPGTFAAEGLRTGSTSAQRAQYELTQHSWTRAEAMSVHNQIINAYDETRRNDSDRELQTKTSRAWWVVWMRLATVSDNMPTPIGHGGRTAQEGFREAILVRRANTDYSTGQSGDTAAGQRITSGVLGRWGRDARSNNPASDQSGSGEAHSTSVWGPSRFSEGIGIDARKYIESLLSLSR